LNPYLGEIKLMAFNFAPKGWALCAGQIMAIQQNTALFSLLGTYYGGNGVQTFALPDLRGRVPFSQGTSTSGSYTIGELAGEENVTLMQSQLPIHNHLLESVNTAGAVSAPFNNYLANSGTTNPRYAPAPPTTTLNPASIQPAGGNLPHSNLQPFLSMNYCIALSGIYPSRN
jgi:microcystin-dependent protein